MKASAMAAMLAAAWCLLGAAPATAAEKNTTADARASHRHHRDHARRQVGKASVYARKFAGRKMANGEPMKPAASNAASKTLPLGTTARVTNLENGKSTVVKIEDRGPHVPGRIVDLSPASAAEIGVTKRQGVAPVAVEPLSVPHPSAGPSAVQAAK